MEMPRRFEAEPPRRVLVIGNHGARRRELAAVIASTFGLPCADFEFEAGATRTDRLMACVSGSDWVMGDSQLDVLDVASRRAEWFIWLDLPMSSCVASILRRAIALRGVGKAGGAAVGGATPSVWAQIRRALQYPAEAMPRIIQTVERERRNRTIFILRTRRDVREFVAKLPRISGLDDPLSSGRRPSE